MSNGESFSAASAFVVTVNRISASSKIIFLQFNKSRSLSNFIFASGFKSGDVFSVAKDYAKRNDKREQEIYNRLVECRREYGHQQRRND